MRDSISRVPEGERTSEVEEIVWTEFMGADSCGRVRYAGQGVRLSKYRRSMSSNDAITKKVEEELMQEVNEKMREKDEQMREEREQMRKEMENMREERERTKGLIEQLTKKLTQMRAEMTQEVVEDVMSYFGLGHFPITPFGPSITPVGPLATPFQPPCTSVRPSASSFCPTTVPCRPFEMRKIEHLVQVELREQWVLVQLRQELTQLGILENIMDMEVQFNLLVTSFLDVD
ncbi:hypothetical protein BUALT_Bualt19G0016500 [Buddleja alternifolia]|uniref:Uncharacterized protein n=1 Tax=Buddleja alternifolia TaxID=168488 RepID=A0AAV6W1C8_9LAMI|nr:hypothetical protein BUALT_Bualt19G0016500 [Buddleja alternifolia]